MAGALTDVWNLPGDLFLYSQIRFCVKYNGPIYTWLELIKIIQFVYHALCQGLCICHFHDGALLVVTTGR